ncbi:MAG TPA: class D sortase, partial [Candidatus Bathyarchaeia archaeon]|nr:class D sortase [Candidatus Bathyarchaeia archaeon]
QSRFMERQEQMRADLVDEEPGAETAAIGKSRSARSTRPSTIGSESTESSLEPLGLLKISKLRLEVPILKGTDELTLNRGLGWIDGTSLPGGEGNSGIAGHRDSFFRHLEDIQVGDAIEVLTPKANHVYTVDGMRVVSPSEIDVLRPREKSSLTLVTCYPFYFIGPAPSRYIVEASLKQ